MTMPKRPRFRRILRRAGLLVSVMILGVWYASIWVGVQYSQPTVGWVWGFDVFDGHIIVARNYWSRHWKYRREGWFLFQPADFFHLAERHYGFELPSSDFGDPGRGGRGGVCLPFWLPFLAAAIPTALLWRSERRIPSGYCQKCGCNLTGNVSGICPECGEACERDESET